MNPKPAIIATCCVILIVVTVYFGGQYLLEQSRIEAPTPSAIPPQKILAPHKASVPRTKLHEADQHLNDQPAKTTGGLGTSNGTSMSENGQNTDSTPISEKTEVVDVPVSPYGFGPYPELPPGYPKDYWDRRMSKEHELLARVRIKLNVEGASMQNGLVYPNFPDTIYVEWDWNGNTRYISRIMGHPDAKRAIRNTFPPSPLTEKDIPANIKMFTLPDGGIDPYEFLNLKKE